MQSYKVVLPLCLTWVSAAWANTAPVADFDVSSIQDLKINLLNQSTDPDGDALKYKWYFGDDLTSKEINPEHVYAQPGIYKITLKVSDGTTTSKSVKKVTVKDSQNNRPPVADFEVSGNRDMKVKLENKSSDPDPDELKYKWYFGDGKTSKAVNPEHTYEAPGTYKITLKVSDGSQTVKTVKKVKVTANQEPVADFDAVAQDLKVTFENKSTDPDGDALKYKWSFGDGTTLKEANPEHTYAAPGVYKVVLATSDGLKTVKTSKTVTVTDNPNNQAPVASYTVKDVQDLKVSLQNTSTDPDNDAMKYKWSFGDGKTSKDANPVHTYEKAGTYKISLKVSDGLLTDTYTQKVVVNTSPVADIYVAQQDELRVQFESGASDADGDVLTYNWDFGDGATSTEQNPEHVYDAFGEYRVTLTVSDGKTEVASDRTVTLDRSVGMSLSGQVVGYLKDARVCLDFNNDSLCSENEPVTETDANGMFNYNWRVNAAGMRGTPYECVLEGTCADTLPLRVLAYSYDKTTKYTLGKESSLKDGIAMSATSFVSVNGDNGFVAANPVIINPYTTITDFTVRGVSAASLTYDKYRVAEGLVAMTLGVDVSSAYIDYNNPADLNQYNLEALVVGEVIARTGMLPNSLRRMQELSKSTLKISDLVNSNYDELHADAMYIVSSVSMDDVGGIADALNSFSDDAEFSMSKVVGNDSDEFRCAISKTKNVVCWGSNASGNLGDAEIFPTDENGEPADGFSVVDNFSASPVKVKVSEDELLSNVVALDSGNGQVCAVTYDGALYCWGSNFFGQAGTGEIGRDADRIFYATRVVKGQQETEGDYLSNIASVTLAHNSSCAVTTDGEAFCWGENTVKQLGDSYPELEINVLEGELSLNDGIDLGGLVKAVPYPVKVNFPDSVKAVKKIVAGLSAYCAIVENKDPEDEHNLYCWGNDTRGLVSHNWMQYREDWLTNYADRVHYMDNSELADPTGDANWNWKLFEVTREHHFLYGAPVTRMEWAGTIVNEPVVDEHSFEFNVPAGNYQFSNDFNYWYETMPVFREAFDEYVAENNYTDVSNQTFTDASYENGILTVTVSFSAFREQKNGIDFTNVTQVDIQGFDGQLMVERNADGKIYGVYNEGAPNSTNTWIMTDSPTTFDGENIVKMDVNVEDKVSYVLGDGGHIYGINGTNKYCNFGMGSRDEIGNEWIPTVAEGEDYWVMKPAKPVLADGTRLANVLDVTSGKKSVCAVVRRFDDNGSVTVFTDTYCWGSSTFGQLGFDNGDGGFSFIDTSYEWNGHDGNNKYYDRENRMEVNPRKVEFR